MFELSFDPPYEYTQPVRDLIGVTETELTDDTLNSISIVGQAEIELRRYLGDLSNVFATAEPRKITAYMLAFINFICFYAYGSLRVSLLLSESDNKTIATRFRDALTRDPNEFKAVAISLLLDAGVDVNLDSPDLLSLVSPATDIITGV